MGLREDIENMEKKIQNIEQESLAMEMLKDYKKANKRQFIIILVILSMWFATVGYLIYILNDLTVVTDEYTQEISEFDSIDNSTITNGDK